MRWAGHVARLVRMRNACKTLVGTFPRDLEDTETTKIYLSLLSILYIVVSQGSSVGVATSYGLDGRGSGVGNFYLPHRVQTGSGAHLVSYPLGAGGKAAGA
jgi:hypothetical protein